MKDCLEDRAGNDPLLPSEGLILIKPSCNNVSILIQLEKKTKSRLNKQGHQDVEMLALQARQWTVAAS